MGIHEPRSKENSLHFTEIMMKIGLCSPLFTHDTTTEIIDDKSGIVELTSHCSADRVGHPV
jgi:hypothetical protein